MFLTPITKLKNLTVIFLMIFVVVDLERLLQKISSDSLRPHLILDVYRNGARLSVRHLSTLIFPKQANIKMFDKETMEFMQEHLGEEHQGHPTFAETIGAYSAVAGMMGHNISKGLPYLSRK